MSRLVVTCYGVVCYLAFNAVFACLAGFLLEVGVVKTITAGPVMGLIALILFWATPQLTLGDAVLAAGMTLYVLIGLRFEERALLRQFGTPYAADQPRVRMLVPGHHPLSRPEATRLARSGS